MRGRLSRGLVGGAALVALAVFGGAGAAAGADARGVPGDVEFWVNPDTAAARQVVEWRQRGRIADAWFMGRIAGRAQAEWLYEDTVASADGTGGTRDVVRGYVEKATAAGRTAVLVAYFVPHRDCGDYSAGGARDAAHYRAWIDAFADGIGTHTAYVVVEPDAVAQEVAGCEGADATERYALLAHAVARLGQQPGAKVYLDAGNASWIPQESRLVEPLRQAGVDQADGFALNVSNYRTTEESTAYGHRLARALGGGKHFVIDTSRNGNGPYTGDDKAWCNPPGRALGTPPTTRTGDPAVDAYLWIKRPGESDGTCRGGPAAGTWWPEYALGLAVRARGAHLVSLAPPGVPGDTGVAGAAGDADAAGARDVPGAQGRQT
ncbi:MULTISPECIES: glycoside hydrolase family 6 protein [Streptomyces]|uniref:glycoside hydrolase family 6 protein n=1 Tax=Streptomyces TaxID=1883 RepID=UPI001EFFFC78|nr:glycoside hydrolase family 6 protein [Streptomyces alboflavus]